MPTEYAHFIDGFDHYPVAWTARKYRRVVSASATDPLAAFSRTTGPYGDQALRVTGAGNSLCSMYYAVQWMHGAFSAHVRVGAAGWGGAGFVAFLRPMWWLGGALTTTYPHHELRVYADGRLEVWLVHGAGAPEASYTYSPVAGAVSAAGAFPLDAWHHLEYHCRPYKAPDDEPGPGPKGYVRVRVDEAEVLNVENVKTAAQDTIHFGDSAYFSFGNFHAAGANGAAVDFDDVCDVRVQSFADADRPTWWGRHRIATALPTGPGSRQEHVVVGGAPAWQAGAALPATPVAADDAYLKKEFGPRAVDLYAVPAMPAFLPDLGAVCIIWVQAVQDPDWAGSAGADPLVTICRSVPARPDRFMAARTGVQAGYFGNPQHERPLLGGLLESDFGPPWELGLGDDRDTTEGGIDTTTDTYFASQVACELWYRTAAPPDGGGGGGGQRWAVGWVG